MLYSGKALGAIENKGSWSKMKKKAPVSRTARLLYVYFGLVNKG